MTLNDGDDVIKSKYKRYSLWCLIIINTHDLVCMQFDEGQFVVMLMNDGQTMWQEGGGTVSLRSKLVGVALYVGVWDENETWEGVNCVCCDGK